MKKMRTLTAAILIVCMVFCMSGSIYAVEEGDRLQGGQQEKVKEEMETEAETEETERTEEEEKKTEQEITGEAEEGTEEEIGGKIEGKTEEERETAEEGATVGETEEEEVLGKDMDTSIQISAPSALLMEVSTGTVLFEQDADTKRPPASVTKIMTMLLIFDAIDSGKISLKDKVPVSEFAASMGGSQVFLEVGETQTVEIMIKCISIASANDACVAMAEYISGSEEIFVQEMNKKAKSLGMENTNFVNCNGLDAQGHVTTARDIAIMSRELITKYPQIHEYAMTWMENITHETKKGSSEFGLTNTNKLVRQYEYATGLKTGSTGEAKFCVSATGKKDDVELIAVVMAAETSKERFSDAIKMMNYGFGKCQVYTDEQPAKTKSVSVKNGIEEQVEVERGETFTYLDVKGSDIKAIKRKEKIKKKIVAPIKKDDVVGTMIYTLDGTEIGRSDIVAKSSVKKAGFFDYLKKAMTELLIGGKK